MKKTLVLTVLSLAILLSNIGTKSAQAHNLSTEQVSVLKHNYQVSLHTIAWHNGKGRWTLFEHHRHCGTVRLDSWAAVCFKHRAIIRAHAARVDRINSLLHPVDAWLGNAFLCIHKYEGSWTSNTGNGYYGGLQMDYGFMRNYGSEYVRRWGTADNWPVWAQIDAAKRAYHSGRGFSPWPNTARACGLI